MSLEELSDLSLITWMNELNTVGISQAAQTNFIKWLSEEGVSDGLERTAKLLHGTYGDQISGTIEKLGMRDYEAFSFCLPHVHSLKNKFRAARHLSPMIKASPELCELLVGCAR